MNKEAVKFFCTRSRTGGFDWHDIYTANKSLQSKNNNYLFDNKEDYIKAINEDVIGFAESEEDKELFKKALKDHSVVTIPEAITTQSVTVKTVDKNHHYLLDAKEGNVQNSTGEITMDATKDIPTIDTTYYYGQFEYNTRYYIEEIKKPLYMVVENFFCPFKGCDSVERLYHKPFLSLEDAVNFRNTFKFKVENGAKPHEDNYYDGQVYISVIDEDNAKSNKWFKKQMEVMDMCNDLGVDIYNPETFGVPVEYHLDRLTEYQQNNDKDYNDR